MTVCRPRSVASCSGTMKVKSGTARRYTLHAGDSGLRPANEPGEYWNFGMTPY